VRVDNEREASPSEVIVDSQSKTAAMVAEAVGYDAAKQIGGANVTSRLIPWVCCGICERSEVNVKKRPRMGKAVSRVHTVWVDGAMMALRS